VYDEAGHAPLLSPRHHLQIDHTLGRSCGVQTDGNRKKPYLGCGQMLDNLTMQWLNGVDGEVCLMRACIVM